MSYDPPKPTTSLGASLASRCAHSTREKANKTRKKYPATKTVVATLTAPMHAAVQRLANKRNVSIQRCLVNMLEAELAKEGITYAKEQDEDE
ncbi:hypothetical protein pEaSNUABM25_00261 [Erwinia phage pEa_SNUABM_25]|nr:hypothetical protein pEaSNUABM25_00261 [Erwinia phage pEa_SNUABM_25]